MKVRIKFYPRDFWIGVYIEEPSHARVYTEKKEWSLVNHKMVICFLPCFPLVIKWKTKTHKPPHWCAICEEITDHVMNDCPHKDA